MAPTTENTSIEEVQEVQELDTTPVTSPSGPPTTPRNRSFSFLSSSSSFSTSSYATAVTIQPRRQGPSPALDVTPSVFSNIVAAGTDASFLGYTGAGTPTHTGGAVPTIVGTEANTKAHLQAQRTASVQNTAAALEVEDEELSEAERDARAWARLQRQKLAFQRVIPHLVTKVD